MAKRKNVETNVRDICTQPNCIQTDSKISCAECPMSREDYRRAMAQKSVNPQVVTNLANSDQFVSGSEITHTVDYSDRR